MNKYALGTVLGSALIGLIKSRKGSPSFISENITIEEEISFWYMFGAHTHFEGQPTITKRKKAWMCIDKIYTYIDNLIT